MVDIRHMCLVDAPVEKVYEAITTQKGLSAWWTGEAIAKPEVGSVAEFKFGDRYHVKMRVLSLKPNQTVEWECFVGEDEWLGTKFRFALEKQGDQTLLRFFHTEWRAMTDFYANCNYHWGYYLRSLKLYCETGEGTPFAYKA